MPPKRGRHIAQDTAQTQRDVSVTATLASTTSSFLGTTAVPQTIAATDLATEVNTSVAVPSTPLPAFTVPKALQARLAARGQVSNMALQGASSSISGKRVRDEEQEDSAEGVMSLAPSTHGAKIARASTAATASATGATMASSAKREKPIILSRRWRAQLITTTTTSSSSADKTKNGATATRQEANPVENSKHTLFSNSDDNVIRFGSRPDDADSSLFSSDDDRESESSEVVGEEGIAAARAQPETEQARRQRKAREVRHRRQFDQHVADYEESALQQHEAALLESEAEDEVNNSQEEDEEYDEDEEEDGVDPERSGEANASEEDRSGDASSSVTVDVHSLLQQRKRGAGAGPQRFGTLFFSSHLDESSLAASLAAAHHRRAQAATTTTTAKGSSTDKDNANAPEEEDEEAAATSDEDEDSTDDECAAFPCFHTLIGVNDPVTIQGPCGVVGLGMGEATVGGFYLGKKQLGLWNPLQRAVVTPVSKLKSKGADRDAAPRWGRGRAYKLPTTITQDAASFSNHGDGEAPDETTRPHARTFECLTAVDVARWREEEAAAAAAAAAITSTSNTMTDASHDGATAAAAADDDDDDDAHAIINMDLNDTEALFGTIDWDWVEAELARWKAFFATRRMPLAVLLVVRPYEPGRSFFRRHYLNPSRKNTTEGHRGDAGATTRRGDAFVELPSFIAKSAGQQIDVALLPDVVPAVAQCGCGSVMVIGSANIGKSTLCRFLVNTFLSQHGLCYWLDMDLGQPEFGVPGQLSLYCVRHPLFRPGDEQHCAELVQALFVGSSTVRCPVTMGNAIAAMTRLVREVQREHPVVVNTHGWVLHTGRRTTTEVIQRVTPRHVIHLLKPKEEAWARDVASLMNPTNGLNADVLSNRFLVRLYEAPQETHGAPNKGGTTATKKKGKRAPPARFVAATPSVRRLGRLPHPPLPEKRKSTGTASSPSAGTDVHSVYVERAMSAAQRHALTKEKGSRGRQTRWQIYFAPLLTTYRSEEEEAAQAKQQASPATLESDEDNNRARPFGNAGRSRTGDAAQAQPSRSTRIRAPLSSLHALVVAELDERVRTLPLQHVVAMLEHGVVAVQFHIPSSSTSNTKRNTPSSLIEMGEDATDVSVRVTSLTALSDGFPLSCYAFVETTEADCAAWAATTDDISEGPMLTLHIPLPPKTVRRLLRRCEEKGGGVSIACSSILREDTEFLEHYH